MITVLFVHGTGTREAAYRESLDTIRQQLASLTDRVRVEGLYWGGEYGTQLHFRGASIPHYGTSRAPAMVSLAAAPLAPDAATGEEILWDSLDRDPLFEFRLFSATTGAGPLPPNAADLEPALIGVLQGPLSATLAGRELVALLRKADLEAAFDRARKMVAAVDIVRRAMIQETPGRVFALARAVMATMLALEPDPASPATVAALDRLAASPAERDGWSLRLARHLHGENRSVLSTAKGAWDALVSGLVAGGAVLAGPWIIRRRRRSITDVGSPAVGDILWYQARGAALRKSLREEVARFAEDGPVVLLAHSLGGIACVDGLLERPEPGVKLLITAGSQAPYFYEIGALTGRALPQHQEPAQLSRPLPHPLPDTFPRWLNFYDPQDLLSYWAAPVFGPPASDHELNNGLRFPAAHSGYWGNPDLWAVARPQIAAL